jgi:hypothetical protein
MNIIYITVSRVSEGALSRWSRLMQQSLAPSNLHWAHVVHLVPFSVYFPIQYCHFSNSEAINRLMIMTYYFILLFCYVQSGVRIKLVLYHYNMRN